MWEQKDCIDYLKTAAVLAAYVDQSISTNTFYSPKHFADKKVPATLIAKNLMLAQKFGLKTLYYSLLDKSGSKLSVEVSTTNLKDVEEIEQEEHCESCVL
jgi:ribonucleoside-diphosphate reductase alpha chain